MKLEDKMAKTPQAVEKFLDDLFFRIKNKGIEEQQQLLDLKKQKTGNKNEKFELWDLTYYGNLYKKKFFNVDEDMIKDYFPSEHVKSATMDIY